MKYLDEYRDPVTARKYLDHIRAVTTRPWTLMEICGGQTHSLVKYGIDQLLPDSIRIVHGPGCPVCVTPLELIDQAIQIAQMPDVIFCSFGDMLRVPGSRDDLLRVKALGGDVRIVYSPLDALRIARDNPDHRVVHFAVGFETTAPANAMAVIQAERLGLKNFSILVSQVLVPPAMEAILSSPDNQVQGFLAAGHVCTIMGTQEYTPISEKYRIPIVVTGFEPIDLLQGIAMCLAQLERGIFRVENQYSRSVHPEGNLIAQLHIREVFQVVDRKWRGVGSITESGLGLAPKYQRFDASRIFEVNHLEVQEDPECISGLVLQGVRRPDTCPAFGGRCTPDFPLGATMVSTEGACSAYFQYRFTSSPGATT